MTLLPRCAACSACCGATTRRPISPRSRAWAASRRCSSGCASRGSTVDLSVEGHPGALPTGVDLTAYRVIQQAVEAAGAAGAAQRLLTIRHGPRDIEISVSDDRPAGAARRGVRRDARAGAPLRRPRAG